MPRPIGSVVYLRGLNARTYPGAHEIIAHGDGDNAGHYLLALPGVNIDLEAGPVGYWAEEVLRDDPDPEVAS